MELPDLLTQGGIATVVILLVGVVKTTLPAFDSARFGAILAIGLGIALANLANLSLGVVSMTILEASLTGLLGGAAASGIYDAGRGAADTAAG